MYLYIAIVKKHYHMLLAILIMANQRHIGLMHSYAKELFTHKVVTVNFLKFVQNLPNITKGLARNLV
jgi:hypothetical protein